MISEESLNNLRNKYTNIHPLIFHRSVERAKTAGELFDILDTLPDKYPIVWDENTKRWKTTKDLFQVKDFSLKKKKE